jgi:hypothetical protein
MRRLESKRRVVQPALGHRPKVPGSERPGDVVPAAEEDPSVQRQIKGNRMVKVPVKNPLKWVGN